MASQGPDTSRFYPGTEWSWTWRVTDQNGAVVDVHLDTITLYLVHGGTTHSFVGDVATAGASGDVIFSLDATETGAIAAGVYTAELVWHPSGDATREQIPYRSTGWTVPARATPV